MNERDDDLLDFGGMHRFGGDKPHAPVETDKATLKAEREQVGSTYRGDWYRDRGIVPAT